MPHGYIRRKWQAVAKSSSEVDLILLVLRLITLVGGGLFLLLAPVSDSGRHLLIPALGFFLPTA